MYIDPQTVISPKTKVDEDSLEVIFDKGPVAYSWSVAKLNYGGHPSIGIRWNGDEIESKLGVPTGRAKPVWFILPDEVADAVRSRVEDLKRREHISLLDDYRAMAADKEREAEANGWIEGLVGDAY